MSYDVQLAGAHSVAEKKRDKNWVALLVGLSYMLKISFVGVLKM